MLHRRCLHLTTLFATVTVILPVSIAPVRAQKQPERRLEFNRDIRPILSENCFVCHGPDNNLRKARLRLDLAAGKGKIRGGREVVVSGQPAKSELFARITQRDPAERMPPPKSKKQLSKAQIALIRQWIEQGGEYQKHWSLIAAKKRELPAVKQKDWVRNPIDRFILARLEKEGIKPSPEAGRRTLIRRLSFDLTGLPPTSKQVDDFVRGADANPQAGYDKLVDRLLKSAHFGERMALYWLDVVRYADTGGYHSDNHRDLWLYRDYVINAFNNNKPFDRFIIEQLAGDLLPNPTRATKIASGFNRLLQTTEEGGAQPKEYAAKYFADRVRNTSSIFLGVTMGCTECHDHKFDPFTTKEFYQFEAFFADLKERPVGRQPQTPLPPDNLKGKFQKLQAQVGAAQNSLNQATAKQKVHRRKWENDLKAEKLKGVPRNIAGILRLPAKRRNAKQKAALLAYYQDRHPQLRPLRQNLVKLQQQVNALNKNVPTSLISMSGPPRTIRILPRGNWLDDSGEIVLPGVPQSILPLKTNKKRADRLDLAKWMVAPDNPLTARVFVNRLWMLSLGQGIVKSVDDFGSQGSWPTHPDLLDWLAVEFRESGWNVRHMIKLMVTSNTYRQTSKSSKSLRQRDPYNSLFARQARFRIEAEMVRDNALAISGLLVRKIGGPSVKPYQPPGYWKHLNFPKRKWTADKGEKQYRRGLYTYWQRTFLHPSLLAFDAPTREECTPQRPRSNTPQQALVLLNDPTYVEAARVFAERVMKKGGKDFDARLQFAYRNALSREAAPAEVKILRSLHEKHLQQYRAKPQAAEQFLQVGFTPAPKNIPAVELAAWTSVTRVIMNLHETVTRN